MKKSIILIVISMLLGAVTAMAQPQKVIAKDFERFYTIKVQDNFVVRLKSSDRYAVRIVCDERIAAHVQAYEKNGVLNLILDEKGYTKELKKQLKQKGAAQPTLEADIYVPEIKSLILMDKVLLRDCDAIRADNFTMTVKDDVKVQKLDINCTSAEIDILRNAVITDAIFNVSEKLTLKASNSSKTSLIQYGGRAAFELNGSATLDMKGHVRLVEVIASSGSESHIYGNADVLFVDGSGFSKTDVEYLEARNGKVTLSGSAKCYSNVLDKLTVNLTGGSMLTFKGMPEFIIERIVNSTLIKADDPKRK